MAGRGIAGIIYAEAIRVIRCFVRICVGNGLTYEYEAPSQRKAYIDVERIKRDGYRRYEGNAVIEYKQVADVAWIQRDM
jgi:hypothetical protein